jgi:hypothetical protein
MSGCVGRNLQKQPAWGYFEQLKVDDFHWCLIGREAPSFFGGLTPDELPGPFFEKSRR